MFRDKYLFYINNYNWKKGKYSVLDSNVVSKRYRLIGYEQYVDFRSVVLPHKVILLSKNGILCGKTEHSMVIC